MIKRIFDWIFKPTDKDIWNSFEDWYMSYDEWKLWWDTLSDLDKDKHLNN